MWALQRSGPGHPMRPVAWRQAIVRIHRTPITFPGKFPSFVTEMFLVILRGKFGFGVSRRAAHSYQLILASPSPGIGRRRCAGP